jgi:hypothetical protein
MQKIMKLCILWLASVILHGCATLEYYELLEPQRSSKQQFIDIPYVYSGSMESNGQEYKFQFSGVLHDGDDKYLDIKIPRDLSRKEHPMISAVLDHQLGHNLAELSNSDVERSTGEPALLVVNPNYPFNLAAIKSQPALFYQQHHLQYHLQDQSLALSQAARGVSDCPNILLLNIDINDERPTTLEYGYCKIKGDHSSYTWQIIDAEKIANHVEHDKIFGHQIAYLGFLVTVPFDVIAAPFYTLGWGLVASKNLMFSGEE